MDSTEQRAALARAYREHIERMKAEAEREADRDAARCPDGVCFDGACECGEGGR